MKPRVQKDVFLLISVIMLTGIFYVSPLFASQNTLLEIILDFLGFTSVLKGTFIRMIARGHKKGNSKESQSLVTTGIYTLVRNPMYLGTLMIGIGFTLILWPWWAVPLFVVIFYQRFRKQIVAEEQFLSQTFGKSYQDYCAKTPRLWPSFSQMLTARTKDMIDLKSTFSTKERWGLLGWPLLAFILACLQQLVIRHYLDINTMGLVFVTAIITFVVGFILKYWFK